MSASAPAPAPARPVDGPATFFKADPALSSLFNNEDDFFGLVLVAGWPPNLDVINPPYKSLLKSIRPCFLDEPGVTVSGSDGGVDDGSDPPNVYLYPSKHLHVTIATLYPNQKRIEGVDYDNLCKSYSSLVKAASQRPEWPKSPLILEIESTQLGSTAGILFWKEVTGGIVRMRQCLEEEAKQQHIKIHHMPNIVHSTFLRFYKFDIPEGEEIQKRFKANVLPRVKEIFADSIHASTTKLVCQTAPYMHIQDDDDHVVTTVLLETKES